MLHPIFFLRFCMSRHCGQDATELVAKLRAYHNTSQLQEDKVSRLGVMSLGRARRFGVFHLPPGHI